MVIGGKNHLLSHVRITNEIASNSQEYNDKK